MKKFIPSFLLVFIFLVANSEPNCNWYKYQGDSLKYEACLVAEERAGHYQFSKEYQEALDRALEIDPTWAYGYRAKSTAYLKSGDFISWISLMNKAVQYDPVENLEYRGWCRFQFFRDYEGAIKDLETLKTLVGDQLGFSGNGDYHLDILLALSYRAGGQKEKAMEIISQKLSESSYEAGKYDHLHLGVIHLEDGNIESSIENLLQQQEINDIAENRYYLSLAYRLKDDKVNYQLNLAEARNLYQSGRKMFDPYGEQIDQIYWEDILNEENISW